MYPICVYHDEVIIEGWLRQTANTIEMTQLDPKTQAFQRHMLKIGTVPFLFNNNQPTEARVSESHLLVSGERVNDGDF